MTATALRPLAAPPPGVPVSDLDPFDIAYFDDPYPAQEALREAGPVVWLSRYGIYAVARYAEVHAVLNDWQTFCSSRGVGLSDFAREKPWRPPSLVLETDPPEHDRARAVLQRVLSPLVMRRLKEDFAAAADTLVAGLAARGAIDGIADLAEAFPLSVFPDAVGLCKEGREHLLPYAGLAFNAFGPDNRLRREALERAAPHVAWVTEGEPLPRRLRRRRPCRRRYGGDHPGGGGAALPLPADGGARHHGERHRRGALLPGAQPR